MTPKLDGSAFAHQSSRARRLEPLTSLRFFAAVLVIFHHCGKAAFSASPEWFRSLIQNGYQAVSFFFVLSGFILVYTYHRADQPSGLRGRSLGFWTARFARIYPTYALALCVALPALLYYTFVKQTTPLWYFASGVATVPLLLQAWVPPIVGAWNGPAWSLSVEACFYAVFPTASRALRKGNERLTLAVVLVGVVAFHYLRHRMFPLSESGAGMFEPTPWHNFMAYFPLLHLPTFVFGMCLGKVYLAQPSAQAWRLAGPLQVGSIAVIGYLFMHHGRIDPLLLSDTVMVPLFGALVFASATATGVANRALSNRWLVELGEASYAIYILHIPLMWWSMRLRSLLPFSGHSFEVVFFWTYLVLVCVFCVLVFECFESPMRRWITSLFKHPSREECMSGCQSQLGSETLIAGSSRSS